MGLGDNTIIVLWGDHKADPDENVNVADKPENAALVRRMASALRAGWKAARPKV